MSTLNALPLELIGLVLSELCCTDFKAAIYSCCSVWQAFCAQRTRIMSDVVHNSFGNEINIQLGLAIVRFPKFTHSSGGSRETMRETIDAFYHQFQDGFPGSPCPQGSGELTQLYHLDLVISTILTDYVHQISFRSWYEEHVPLWCHASLRCCMPMCNYYDLQPDLSEHILPSNLNSEAKTGFLQFELACRMFRHRPGDPLHSSQAQNDIFDTLTTGRIWILDSIFEYVSNTWHAAIREISRHLQVRWEAALAKNGCFQESIPCRQPRQAQATHLQPGEQESEEDEKLTFASATRSDITYLSIGRALKGEVDETEPLRRTFASFGLVYLHSVLMQEASQVLNLLRSSYIPIVRTAPSLGVFLDQYSSDEIEPLDRDEPPHLYDTKMFWYPMGRDYKSIEREIEVTGRYYQCSDFESRCEIYQLEHPSSSVCDSRIDLAREGWEIILQDYQLRDDLTSSIHRHLPAGVSWTNEYSNLTTLGSRVSEQHISYFAL